MTRDARPPIALTIAGSDSSGCAGVQADLRTFSAHDIHGASVITALTAQHVTGVEAVEVAAPSIVSAQLTTVLERLPVRAAKTGMLAGVPQMDAIWAALAHHPEVPLVIDPVLRASSGDALAEGQVAERLIETWLPRATVITPNLDEARALVGADDGASEEEVREAFFSRCRGKTAVVVKGGHNRDPTQCADHVQLANGVRFILSAPRLETPASRGTGCTFSAAITAGLARGASVDRAIRDAKRYITGALRHARPLVKSGGPVDQLWTQFAGEELP